MLVMLAVLSAAGLVAGAEDKDKKDKPSINIEITLPESQSFGLDEYASKLTIDGKDFSKKIAENKASLLVTPEKGKDSVKVVYTYWPYGYSKTVRTKIVKLEDGKVAKASLLKEDTATPDMIFPIYVPTPQEVVDKMCEVAKLTKDDVVCDIGCGDGRLVITAVKKFGAKKGIGWDYAEDRIKECNENKKKEKLGESVIFEQKDALKLTDKDLSPISVVFLYVGEDLGAKLGPMLKKSLKPGARVISHRFPMGDWKADKDMDVKIGDGDYTVKLLVWEIKKEKKGEKKD